MTRSGMRLAKALDELNGRFGGNNSLHCMENTKLAQTKRNFRTSPAYTTNWMSLQTALAV